MASPSDALKRQYAFFHSVGKTLTEETQFTFNSGYSAGHVIFTKDVLVDAIPHLADQTAADAFAASNPTILKKYTLKSLTEIIGSNGQTWHIEDGGEWIRPLMLPALAPDPITNEPSNGLIAFLYQDDNTFIPPTDGVFYIDPYQGIVKFEEGFTPSDMGWGTPKITCYAYVGNTLSDPSSGSDGTFVGLTDTPNTYAGFENYVLAVDGSGTEIVFVDINDTLDDLATKIEVAAVTGDLQTQIDDLQDDFVKKSGDTMSGDLRMDASSVRISGGEIELNGSILSNVYTTGVISNTLIDQVTAADGNCVFWDLLVSDGTNFRASRLMVVWDDTASALVINETSTDSIGDTDGVVMQVNFDVTNTFVQLKAQILSGAWNIKAFKKFL